MRAPLYRPCVGIVLFNRKQQVWSGQRNLAAHQTRQTKLWQFPQGGIDKGETPLAAARRELHEETGARSVQLLHEHDEWLTYDLPPTVRRQIFRGRYRGQRQKWFAFLFEGSDEEFNLNHHAPAEFTAWRWMELQQAAQEVVEFKQPLYEQITQIFSRFAANRH